MRSHWSKALLLSLLVIAGLLTWTPTAAGDPGKSDLWSQRHRLDLGLYAGVLFPPRAHELYDAAAWQEPFDVGAFDVGLRVGYMPWPFIGMELEGGVMPTQTREGGDSALLYTIRAHVIGQYPARFSPFLLAGYGLLGVNSSESAVGNDVDGAFHAGLGLKFHATERLTMRADGRLLVSGQAGPTGFMPYFEVLLGASYMLFWTEVVSETKDSDGDGVPDDKDKCPAQPETKNGHQDEDGCPDTVPPKVVKFSGTFPDVRFWLNSSQLRAQDKRTLRRVLKALKKHPNLRIKLRGHADETGPEDYNLDLSRKRAEAVRQYLVRNGARASQLEVEALGEAEPISSEQQARNRRVEFKIDSN